MAAAVALSLIVGSISARSLHQPLHIGGDLPQEYDQTNLSSNLCHQTTKAVNCGNITMITATRKNKFSPFPTDLDS